MGEGIQLPPLPDWKLPSTGGLYDALLAVQAAAQELDLRRNAAAEQGSARFRRYLDYPKLLAEVRPLLTEHGLVWQTFPTTMEDGSPALRYRLVHVASRQTDEDTVKLMLDKQTSQAQGSALTYARRYALLNVLNLAPDGDDDGEAASRPPRPAPVDPEAPMPEERVTSMFEAIAEAGLSRPKVLERAGWTEGEPLLMGHAQKVATILKERAS